MTGYTVHTGSTKKFSSSWDRIFSGAKTTGSQAAKKSDETSAPSKVLKKAAAKKAPTRAKSVPVKKTAVKKVAAKKATSKAGQLGK